MTITQRPLSLFRIIQWFGTVFFPCLLLCSCGTSLNEQKAIELIRLNYRQQSTTEGAGKWILDSIVVDKITRLKGDSVVTFRVDAHTTGYYRLPSIEDAPNGATEQFFDTLQFMARKYNKVWMADDWTVIGSRHE